MCRFPFSRLLLAAALALVLAMPAPAVFAAPAETPVLTHLSDWLTWLFHLPPGPPAHHGDTQETIPTLDPNAVIEAPSPTLTHTQTEEEEGETIPTIDPNG